MSPKVSKMSPNVSNCLQMSVDVSKYLQMSQKCLNLDIFETFSPYIQAAPISNS